MTSRYEYMDRIVLFLSCSIIYIAFYNNELSVLPILAALSMSCFLLFFDKTLTVRMLLYALFMLLSFYNLDLVYFTPLIIYDLIEEKHKLLFILPIISLSQFILSYGLLESLLIFIVFVIAVFIRFKSTDIVGFKGKYYRLLDDTKELTITLNQNNKTLLEKQDNEIYIATLNERNRIAREIHDHVGHQLSSSILQLGALMVICKDDATKAQLIELKKTLDLGMDNIRRSVHDLYDTSIDMNIQIQSIVDHFKFCSVHYDNSITHLPPQKQCYAFIAIIKEAFSNIIKHSDATLVNLALREHPSLYQLIIADNGNVGSFQPDKGIGLKNIEQRVAIFNGHLKIKTDQGFEIFISIPKLI